MKFMSIKRLPRRLRLLAMTHFTIMLLVCPTHAHAQASVKESEQLDFAQGLLSRGMYDMAILEYQKFITNYPHSPSLQEAYLSLGEGYFLSQEFDRAINVFNQFKQLFPNSSQLPVSVLRLGQIDLQENKYNDALKEFNSIDFQNQLKGPMLQSFEYYTAETDLDLNDTASALDFFQKAAQVAGATEYTASALKEIGKIQVAKGNYTEAMDSYTKAMNLAQDDALKGELIYRIAEVQFLTGQYADAIKGFKEVLEQFSSLGFNQDALANLLLSYFNLGQYDQLLSEYQKDLPEIKDDDAYFTVHYAAVLAYIELSKYDQASALLDRLLKVTNLTPEKKAKIFIKKADILERQKNYKDALALLQADTSSNTDDADERLFLEAQCYFGLNDFDQAYNFYGNVIGNYPNSRFSKAALLGQAHARKATGSFKESEGLFLKYVDAQDQPDLKSDALYDAVMMAVKAGDLNGIINNAQTYLKEFPNGEQFSNVLFMLADTYGSNKRAKEAVDLLQGYLSNPVSAQRSNSAYFLLGFSQELLGNSDEALSDYAKVDQHKEDGKFYVAALKNMAIIFLSQKNDTQAKIYFDRMISQGNQNGLQLKTYIWVCNEYLKEQKFDDVLRIATRAQENFPQKDLNEIIYFKAEALRGLGSCDEAIKNYDIVISNPNKDAYTGSAHIGNGLCLEDSKKFDEAKGEFQKSLDENTDDYTVTAHAQFELANLNAAQGNFDEAIKYYLLVATIYDDEHFCSESLLRGAQISERLKRKDDALKMYSEILDKYKNSPAADYAKQRIGLLK